MIEENIIETDKKRFSQLLSEAGLSSKKIDLSNELLSALMTVSYDRGKREGMTCVLEEREGAHFYQEGLIDGERMAYLHVSYVLEPLLSMLTKKGRGSK